jgi:uncharacterized C2H2 Zn-finger protein
VKTFHQADETPYLECTTCFAVFKTANKLKNHILKLHSEITKTFVCETCDARYLSESELQNHTASRHKSGESVEYLCQHCGKALKTKNELKNHVTKMHSEPVYDTCNICSARIVSTTS